MSVRLKFQKGWLIRCFHDHILELPSIFYNNYRIQCPNIKDSIPMLTFNSNCSKTQTHSYHILRRRYQAFEFYYQALKYRYQHTKRFKYVTMPSNNSPYPKVKMKGPRLEQFNQFFHRIARQYSGTIFKDKELHFIFGEQMYNQSKQWWNTVDGETPNLAMAVIQTAIHSANHSKRLFPRRKNSGRKGATAVEKAPVQHQGA